MRSGRFKIDEAQNEVREQFGNYIRQFPSQNAAARKIGITEVTLRDWRDGRCAIPDWFCEHLGFKRQYVFVGSVGITTRSASAEIPSKGEIRQTGAVTPRRPA